MLWQGTAILFLRQPCNASAKRGLPSISYRNGSASARTRPPKRQYRRSGKSSMRSTAERQPSRSLLHLQFIRFVETMDVVFLSVLQLKEVCLMDTKKVVSLIAGVGFCVPILSPHDHETHEAVIMYCNQPAHSPAHEHHEEHSPQLPEGFNVIVAATTTTMSTDKVRILLDFFAVLTR